jgi:hypothetical protein
VFHRARLDVPAPTLKTVTGWIARARRGPGARLWQRAATVHRQVVLVLRWLRHRAGVQCLALDAPVWSGSTAGKVRLNRGGNRTMNWAQAARPREGPRRRLPLAAPTPIRRRLHSPTRPHRRDCRNAPARTPLPPWRLPDHKLLEAGCGHLSGLPVDNPANGGEPRQQLLVTVHDTCVGHTQVGRRETAVDLVSAVLAPWKAAWRRSAQRPVAARHLLKST